MSNEELAALICSGAREYELELWEQIKRYAMKTANRWLAALPLRSDIDFDDLISSAYIAMCEAVVSYKADSGMFTTWYGLHLKKAFTELYGLHTRRAANDPLNAAVSLSTPIDESEEVTMQDTIPDPASAESFERVEGEVYRQQLHDALCEALRAIPDDLSDIIQRRYFRGQTVKSIAAERSTTAGEISKRERSGLQAMRRSPAAIKLRGFTDFNPYMGTGLGSFRSTGASVQESYLLREERMQHKRIFSEFLP